MKAMIKELMMSFKKEAMLLKKEAMLLKKEAMLLKKEAMLLKKEYYEKEFPEVKRLEHQLVDEFGEGGREMRRSFLNNEVERFLSENEKILQLGMRKDIPGWLIDVLKGIKDQEVFGYNEYCRMYKVKHGLSFLDKKKKIKTYLNELRHLDGVDKGFDHLNIVRARQYPIDNLVNPDSSNKIICPWHSDHDPSLHIYKDSNDCYCFVCNHYDDVIGLAMALWGVKFVEAVKRLC